MFINIILFLLLVTGHMAVHNIIKRERLILSSHPQLYWKITKYIIQI